MPYEENSLIDQDTNKYRCQDLNENPHIAAWFFEKCFKLFFENVLMPK